MARIRSIKPEFPQSETIGRLSRDARLLFVQLWTIADDEGRGRGAYPVLAGSLYPYDAEALALLPSWMEELIEAGCVVRYERDRSTYFQIVSWAIHQKIDKPTPSRFPPATGETVSRLTEKDVETELFECLKSAGSFLGQRIVDVQRQVRVGSSYLDVVVKAGEATFVFEIKRDRITGADVGQVMRYCALVSGTPILVGAGMSPRLSVSECEQHDIAVMSFEKRELSVIVQSSAVTERSITFPSVIESYSPDLGPRTRDLGSRISEASASGAEAPDERPDPAVAERDLFDRGKKVLGPGAGGVINNLLKAKGGNVALARAVVEQASQAQNSMEYVQGAIRGQQARASPQRRQTASDTYAEMAFGGLNQLRSMDRERADNPGIGEILPPSRHHARV